MKLCSTFINLFKSRGLDSDDMAKEQFFDTMHHFLDTDTDGGDYMDGNGITAGRDTKLAVFITFATFPKCPNSGIMKTAVRPTTRD